MTRPSKTREEPGRPRTPKDVTETDSDSGGQKERSHQDRVVDEVDSRTDQLDRADDIGYQKPPREHQWPKGRSGNPAGRKKGSRNRRTIIVRLMEQKLGRKIDDLAKLTRHEALLLKGIQKTLSGDTKAMAFILRRYDDASAVHDTASVATERDETVYAALVEKIKRELTKAE